MAKQLVASQASLEEMKDDQWESRTAPSPKRWLRWHGTKIKITPIPTDYADNQVKIDYIEMPTALSTDASTVDSRIPETQQEHLKYAAAAYLLQMMNDEQNIALADRFLQQFDALIKEVR